MADSARIAGGVAAPVGGARGDWRAGVETRYGREWYDTDNHGVRRLHRGGDAPAIVNESGHVEYYAHGARHRGGGLPAVIYPNGRCMWWERGLLHRAGPDGRPAADRPAVVNPHPSCGWCGDPGCECTPCAGACVSSREWWVRGVQVTPVETADGVVWTPVPVVGSDAE